LSGSKQRSYFSPFVDQSSPNLTGVYGSDLVCNAVFRWTISCSHLETFAIKLLSPKSGQNFDVFGTPNFFWEGTPKFLTQFYKLVTTEHVAKFGDSRPKSPRLGGEKSKRIETTAAFYNGRRPASWLAATITMWFNRYNSIN